MLNALNGSYIMGYSDMDKKPFESLSLVVDSFDEIEAFIEADDNLKEIAKKTKAFLDGFYSDFGLELLSSIDYLMRQYGTISVDDIYNHLSQWSHRKGKIFNDHRFIEIAKRHLIESGFTYSN